MCNLPVVILSNWKQDLKKMFFLHVHKDGFNYSPMARRWKNKMWLIHTVEYNFKKNFWPSLGI